LPYIINQLNFDFGIAALQCRTIPYWDGYIVSSADSNYGVTVNLMCGDNMTFIDGRTMLSTRCLADAKWSPAIVQCTGTWLVTGFMKITAGNNDLHLRDFSFSYPDRFGLFMGKILNCNFFKSNSYRAETYFIKLMIEVKQY
jgi:hypothetical protein